ncbi:MAG: hypothetical protein AAFP19_26180, partial [Bacteroidota bacterium]
AGQRPAAFFINLSKDNNGISHENITELVVCVIGIYHDENDGYYQRSIEKETGNKESAVS